MTPAEIAFIEDILAGKRSWNDFFSACEEGLYAFLKTQGTTEECRIRLVEAAKKFFVEWCEEEMQLFLHRYVTNRYVTKSYLIITPVSTTLQKLLLPSMLYCIDAFPGKVGIICEVMLERHIKVVCKSIFNNKENVNNRIFSLEEKLKLYKAVKITLKKLKQKSKDKYYIILASGDYALNRAVEQLLVLLIKRNDTASIEKLVNFLWLGEDKQWELTNEFEERINFGIKGDFRYEIIKDKITFEDIHSITQEKKDVVDERFFEKAKNYIWGKMVYGDERTSVEETRIRRLEVETSLIGFLKGQIFPEDTKRGIITNFISRKEVQDEFGYVLTDEKIDGGQLIIIPRAVLKPTYIPDSEPLVVDNLVKDEFVEEALLIIRKAFWSDKLKIHRQRLIYNDEFQKLFSYVFENDSNYNNLLKETYGKNADIGWGNGGKEVPPSETIFKSQRSQAYNKFREIIDSHFGIGGYNGRSDSNERSA